MAYMKLSYYSPTMQHQEDVSIFYPDAFDHRNTDDPASIPGNGRGYQVLWLMHGGGGNYMDWPLQADFFRAFGNLNLVVVMPTMDDHLQELVIGDNQQFITQELPKYISSFLPISRRREDNFIAGFSLGGYFVYRAAMLHPEQYCAVCSTCGPIDIIGDLQARVKNSEAHVEQIRNTDLDMFWLTKKMMDEGIELPYLYQVYGTTDFAQDVNSNTIEYFTKIGRPNWEYIQIEGGHDYTTSLKGIELFLQKLNRNDKLVALKEV